MASPLPGTPFTFKPRSLSDAVDGTNTFPGAMSALQNLIPSPDTASLFVPRPAAVAMPGFANFTSASAITLLYTVGNMAYGMISSGLYVGKDQPFAFNMLTQTLLVITGVAAANLPASPAPTGDWTPPTAAAVAGRIMITHPGFPGGAIKFGWLDISGYSLTSLVGDTHSTTLIDNIPSSPLLAGVQPGMAIAGTGIPVGATVVSATATSITISVAATSTVGAVPLTITGGTATAPQWNAGDLNTNGLSAVPVAVAQFSQRAYFAVADGVEFSDAGQPTQRTNATQALTFRNGLDVTALASLPLYSSTQGGIVASLLCFQGASGMQQIAGDVSTNDLRVNAINNTTGTLAPNTIVPIPGGGLSFVAPDGLRIVDYTATVSDPIGAHGAGVNVPFRYALTPSRMCAAFNQSVLRISLQNGKKANQPFEEYWFDISTDQKVWTGPHSFPAALIQPWQGPNNTFVMAPSSSLQTSATTPTIWGSFTWGAAPWGGTPIAAQLFQSDPQATVNSSYVENGATMIWSYATTLLPDNQQAAANSVIEATLGLQLPANINVGLTIADEVGNILDQVQIVSAGAAQTTWGAFTWGAALWAAQQANYLQYPIDFTGPLVFKQAIFMAAAQAASGSGIGNLYMRIEPLSYIMRGVTA